MTNKTSTTMMKHDITKRIAKTLAAAIADAERETLHINKIIVYMYLMSQSWHNVASTHNHAFIGASQSEPHTIEIFRIILDSSCHKYCDLIGWKQGF